MMKTCPPNFEFRVSSFEFPSALWTFHIYINIYQYIIYIWKGMLGGGGEGK